MDASEPFLTTPAVPTISYPSLHTPPAPTDRPLPSIFSFSPSSFPHFASLSVELLRVEATPTPFALTSERCYPTTYPVTLSPSLSLHLSSLEWSTAISAINASLVWPRPYLVSYAVGLAVVVSALALSALGVGWMGSASWSLAGQWLTAAGLVVAFAGLGKVLRLRVQRRMEGTVRRLSSHFDIAEPALREGRLPCSFSLHSPELVSRSS